MLQPRLKKQNLGEKKKEAELGSFGYVVLALEEKIQERGYRISLHD